MKLSISTKLFGILVLSLLVIVTVSSDAMAQGRGRRASNLDKKCAKFVNCHDARDGRWDGRGPDRDRFDNRFRRHRRNRDFDDISWRRRHRNSDDWRRRHRDRDFDNNHRWHRRR